MRAEAHVNQRVKGIGRGEFEVVKQGQQKDGNGRESQRQSEVFALFERRGLDGCHHAEVHGAHVGDQQPREEPLRVEHCPGQNDGGQHGEAGACFDSLLPSSKLRYGHQEDRDDHVQPGSAVGRLCTEPLLDSDPIAQQVRGAERKQRDVNDP